LYDFRNRSVTANRDSYVRGLGSRTLYGAANGFPDRFGVDDCFFIH